MMSNARNNTTALMHAWEFTQQASAWQRPAALLAALSGMPLDEALNLGVAQRDAALVAWRSAIFGKTWQAFAQCPACNTMLEYELPHLDDSTESTSSSQELLDVELRGHQWRVRLPNSRDIYEASLYPDRSTGRSILLRRMLLEEADIDADAGVAILAAASEAHHSLLTVTVQCCACPHAWMIVFDPGEFLWREVRAAARRILREIDLIARIYHWSEEQILALSDVRRREYLQMVQ